MISSGKNTFLRHFVWYLSGAIFPLLINFIKTPIFTRHYSAEDFGILGLVLISVGYLSTVLFSWLTSCLWRFYPKFNIQKKLDQLYHNLIFLYVITSIIMLVLAFLATQFFSNNLINNLIYAAAFHFILREFLNLYFIILRLKGKSKRYNLLISLQTILSFILLIIMSFVLHFDIAAMIYSLVLIDLAFIFYLVVAHSHIWNHGKILRLKIDKKIQSELFNFGGFTLISTLLLMLIVSSDRYIISLYEPMKQVGIYTKTYDVAQMSILALIFIFFSTINPTMNHVLENDKVVSKPIISKYIHAFSFLFIPIVVFASIFSREITQILLGPEFQTGYVLMPYIFVSMLFFGVIKFYENEYKFAGKLTQMNQFFLFALIINVLLNFLLIPRFGMIWAAVSTLVSYGLILLLFMQKDKFAHFRNQLYNKRFGLMLLYLMLIFIMDILLRSMVEFNLLTGLIEAAIFIGVFVLLFFKDIKSLQIPMFE